MRVASGTVWGNPALSRKAAVLVWVPVLLAGPVIDVVTGVLPWWSLALVLAVAAACSVAVVDSWPAPTLRSGLAWAALAVLVLAASLAWHSWSAAWLLVGMAAALGLPTKGALSAIPLSGVVAGALTYRADADVTAALEQGFIVALAGTTAGVLSELLRTTDALRRTREQLARAAVAQERERVARDLHDVLGHTLSVMVVKAAAVRRLAAIDPAAAAAHAADIEEVGRSALGRVRETIHAASAPTLVEEVASARDALAAAGIEATLPTATEVPEPAGVPLAWALREGVTNVLRHSAASRCRVELVRVGGAYRLSIVDDGVGRVTAAAGHDGGLAGLRGRLSAAGGGLDVNPGSDGFTLTAWVPESKGRS